MTCFKQDGSIAESQISNYLRLHDFTTSFCFFVFSWFWSFDVIFVGIRLGELQTIWICISIRGFSFQRAPMEAGVPWKHWEPWVLMRCGISASDVIGFEAGDDSRFTRCTQYIHVCIVFVTFVWVIHWIKHMNHRIMMCQCLIILRLCYCWCWTCWGLNRVIPLSSLSSLWRVHLEFGKVEPYSRDLALLLSVASSAEGIYHSDLFIKHTVKASWSTNTNAERFPHSQRILPQTLLESINGSGSMAHPWLEVGCPNGSRNELQ